MKSDFIKVLAVCLTGLRVTLADSAQPSIHKAFGNAAFASSSRSTGQHGSQSQKQGETALEKSALMSRFLCTDAENERATKVDRLAKAGITVHDWCIMGVNKFGWACGLTAVSRDVLLVCWPCWLDGLLVVLLWFAIVTILKSMLHAHCLTTSTTGY